MRSSYLEFWISRSTRGTLDYAPDFGRRSAPSDKTLAVGAQVLGRGLYNGVHGPPTCPRGCTNRQSGSGAVLEGRAPTCGPLESIVSRMV
jgi:hypothetical protein